jgi:hypothetical protein
MVRGALAAGVVVAAAAGGALIAGFISGTPGDFDGACGCGCGCGCACAGLKHSAAASVSTDRTLARCIQGADVG